MSRETGTTTRAITDISTRTTTPKPRSDVPPALRLVLALVALPLVFFAHSYPITALTVVAGALVVALAAPPAIARRGVRALDVAMLAVLAAIAVQLIPLRPETRAAIAPASAAFDRLMIVGAATRAARAPISVDPDATRLALAIVAAMALIFWSTRRALQRGGLRTVARGIATLGLVLVPVSVLHHLNVVPGLDAVWPPGRRDLRPWGPFVNRNDFAGWLLLGAALTLGYLVTHLEARHHHGERLDPDRAFDRTGTRLAAGVCVMTAGIMISLSRSALLGVSAGLLLFFALGRRRLPAQRRAGLLLMVLVLLGLGAVFANVGALASRLEVAMSEGVTGRMSIWTQTWPAVVDFWPLGAGVGSYGRVMGYYQTSTRLITIAHADDEPLQLALEGGALVAVPILVACIAFVASVARRLREDHTAMFWIRAGAAAGLLAIAVQNLVEMTLRVPANGLLAVVLAAIAAHERR